MARLRNAPAPPADTPPAPPAPAPAPEKPAAKPGDPPPAPEKPAAKPPEAKPDGQPAADANKPKAKTLRDVLNTTRDELKRVTTEFEEYKKQSGQPKADPEKSQLQERLTATEKRLADYEEEMRYVDFTRSPDYKRDYETPYISAYNEGRAIVSKLKITDGETGASRLAAADDFDRIMAIQDPDAAAQAIEDLFGTGQRGNMVSNARAKALDILNKATQAEAEWKEKGKERTKQRQEATKSFFKKVVDKCTALWNQAQQLPFNDEKIKWQYTPEPDNAREATLFAEGQKLAKEGFATLNAYDPTLTDEQRESIINKHAEIYNKASAYDMLIHRLARMKKKLANAEAKIKGYEDTAPPPGGGQRGPAAAAPVKGWEASRQSLLKRVKPSA